MAEEGQPSGRERPATPRGELQVRPMLGLLGEGSSCLRSSLMMCSPMNAAALTVP
jgi:hypothetical protein